MFKRLPTEAAQGEVMRQDIARVAQLVNEGELSAISLDSLKYHAFPEDRGKAIISHLMQAGVISEENLLASDGGYEININRLRDLISGESVISPEIAEKSQDVKEAIAEETAAAVEEVAGGEKKTGQGEVKDPDLLAEAGNAGQALHEAVEENREILEAREVFYSFAERIRAQGLMIDVRLAHQDEAELREKFFSLGPRAVAQYLENLEACLERLTADLNGFTIEVFSDNRMAIPSDRGSVVEIGFKNLQTKSLPSTARQLERMTENVAREQNALEEDRFQKEQETVEERVAHLNLDPVLRKKIVERRETEAFFRNLRFVLGLGAGPESILPGIASLTLSISNSGSEVTVNNREIRIGSEALKKTAFEKTAQTIRKTILPITTNPPATRGGASPSKTPAQEARQPDEIIGFLTELAAAPRDRWPDFLARAAGMLAREQIWSWQFDEISKIIGAGRSPELLADDNRATAGNIAVSFEGPLYEREKQYRDPIHIFMREVLHLSDEEIEKIDFKYDVVVGQEPAADGNPSGGSPKMVTCSNYHDFLRIRQNIPPDERVRLDGIKWGSRRFVKTDFSAHLSFWDRLENGGDFAAHNSEFYDLMLGIVCNEYAPDDFAVWAKQEEARASGTPAAEAPPAEAGVAVPEAAQSEAIGEDAEEERGEAATDLATARTLYAEAYAAYFEAIAGRRDLSLRVGGADTAPVEAARTAYDVALRAAAENIRNDEMARVRRKRGLRAPGEALARANKRIFEELVVKEEKLLADLRIGEIPPEEKGFWEKAWLKYARLPRWQKLAISAAVGGTAAAITGGSTAVLMYAGRRGASLAASMIGGAVATGGIETFDQTIGKKNTKEYQIDLLLRRQRADISENLNDMKQEYKGILEQQAAREKKRIWLKVGIAALAGVGTGVAWHHFASAGPDHAPVGAHKPSAPIEQQHVGSSDKQSSLGAPTKGSEPAPESTPARVDHTVKDDSTAPPAPSPIKIPNEPPAEVLEPSGSVKVGWETPPDVSHTAGPEIVAEPYVKPNFELEPQAPQISHPFARDLIFNRSAPSSGAAVAPSLENPGESAADFLHKFSPESGDHNEVPFDLSKIGAHNEPIPSTVFHEPEPAPEMLQIPVVRPAYDFDHPHPGGGAGDSMETHSPAAPFSNPDTRLTDLQDYNRAHQLHPIPPPPRPPRLFDDHGEVRPSAADQADAAPTGGAPSSHAEEQLASEPQHAVGAARSETVPSGGSPAANLEEARALIRRLHEQNRVSAEQFEQNMAEAQKIVRGSDPISEVRHLTPMQRAEVLVSLAQQAKDEHFDVAINISDPEAVLHKIQDYTIAYPEAQRLGFETYDQYAGVRDIPLNKFLNEMPGNARAIRSALQHSFMHPGGRITENVNGVLKKVPLMNKHVLLMRASWLAQDQASVGKTVGEVLALHAGDIDRQLPAIRQFLDQILKKGGQ